MDQSEVLRQAEERRRRLLVNREERMKKILLGGKAKLKDASVNNDNLTHRKKDMSCCSSPISRVGGFSNSISDSDKSNHSDNNETDEDGRVGHSSSRAAHETFNNNGNNSSRDNFANSECFPDVNTKLSSGSSDLREEKEPLVPHGLRHRKTDADNSTFPRKVSLISSKIDLKASQQSQCQKSKFLIDIYAFILTLTYKFSTIFPLICLMSGAIIGSMLQYNIMYPFLISQIIILCYAAYRYPQQLQQQAFIDSRIIFSFKLMAHFRALVSDLIVHTTFYIATSALYHSNNYVRD